MFLYAPLWPLVIIFLYGETSLASISLKKRCWCKICMRSRKCKVCHSYLSTQTIINSWIQRWVYQLPQWNVEADQRKCLFSAKENGIVAGVSSQRGRVHKVKEQFEQKASNSCEVWSPEGENRENNNLGNDQTHQQITLVLTSYLNHAS